MEKDKVSIRHATAADKTLLAELGAKTFQETFAADNTPENMAAYVAASFSPDMQLAELADPSSVFLIAEVKGSPVGYARLRTGRPPAGITGFQPIEIVRLYALKEWIGHGIGASLMRACLSEAGLRGCDVVWLDVWERNLRARNFYRQWGFVEVGTQLFQLGDDLQNDLLMQRSAAPAEIRVPDSTTSGGSGNRSA